MDWIGWRDLSRMHTENIGIKANGCLEIACGKRKMIDLTPR
jgi:hypothetical protein